MPLRHPNSLVRRFAATSSLLAVVCAVSSQEVRPFKALVSQAQAVELAERFVLENGYTSAPESVVKAQLDPESLEMVEARKDRLELRRNTLRPRAIGIKRTDEGWGVAFDHRDRSSTCRVVLVSADGRDIAIQHKDGIRSYWRGLGER